MWVRCTYAGDILSVPRVSQGFLKFLDSPETKNSKYLRTEYFFSSNKINSFIVH